MSDVIDIPRQGEEPGSVRNVPPRSGLRWPRRRRRSGRPPKPRVRKLRLLLILIGLGFLAAVSTVFGMMMAVASDLPQLENRAQYQNAVNSVLYDDHWRPIGLFAPPNNVVVDQFLEISPYMRRAIVAIEDRRFWSNPGVDIRGIARAFLADITGGARQGASTIAQQFVKNALAEQNNRTIFEKLREAALAYHLTRKWSKKKILTEYLNSIYFGNGAYGVESAARVYFGKEHGYGLQAAAAGTTAAGTTATGTSTDQSATGGCGDSTSTIARPKCAFVLHPWEAALLAGMVASPTAFDPITNPGPAKDRRNLVLRNMYLQHLLSRSEYLYSRDQPLPKSVQQPEEPTAAPYFTSWLRPQILAAMGLGHRVPANVAEYRAYYGGLKIRTTLDLDMQRAAEQAVTSELPPGSGLPSASVVAIDNKTGEVRAMVGGDNYAQAPFNIATEGHRQPGSAFKPFTLAVALESGYGPDSLLTSAPADFIVPHSGGKEHFIVHNFGNAYSGTISLANATAYSDNSAYSRLGIDGLGKHGTQRIARMARRMGIRSHVSSNYAMILGGLTEGVTPLDMAHAYETFATGGLRVFNRRLGTPNEGPTGIAQIYCPAHVCRGSAKAMTDKPAYQRILPPAIAAEVHSILTGPVRFGTATNAQIPGVDVAGKTGTTSNYGDAWFVGWTPQMTTAVWVGYPTKLVSMSTSYNGQPVEGGTYPAIIWHNFMVQALQILAAEQAATHHGQTSTTSTTDTTGITAPSGSAPSTATSGSSSGTSGTGGTGGGTAGAGTTGAGTGGGTTGGGTTPGTGGGTTGGGTGGGSGGGSGSGGAGLGGGG